MMAPRLLNTHKWHLRADKFLGCWICLLSSHARTSGIILCCMQIIDMGIWSVRWNCCSPLWSFGLGPGLNFCIRYVGVVRSVFMFSNFYQFDILQQNVSYISRSIRKHQQKSDGKVDLSLDQVTPVNFLTEYIGPPNHVHYRVWSSQ